MHRQPHWAPCAKHCKGATLLCVLGAAGTANPPHPPGSVLIMCADCRRIGRSESSSNKSPDTLGAQPCRESRKPFYPPPILGGLINIAPTAGLHDRGEIASWPRHAKKLTARMWVLISSKVVMRINQSLRRATRRPLQPNRRRSGAPSLGAARLSSRSEHMKRSVDVTMEGGPGRAGLIGVTT